MWKWLLIWMANYWFNNIVYSTLKWLNNWICFYAGTIKHDPLHVWFVGYVVVSWPSVEDIKHCLKPNPYHFLSAVFASPWGYSAWLPWQPSVLLAPVVLCLGSVLHMSLVCGFNSHSQWLGSHSTTCGDYHCSWLVVCVIFPSSSLWLAVCSNLSCGPRGLLLREVFTLQVVWVFNV